MTQQVEILPMATGTVAVYNPFRAQLADLKKQNSLLAFDYESAAGNKEARSYIYKLRKTKSAVEEARKKEKQESLEYSRKVDAEAKVITGGLESMIDVHQKAIDDIEQREKNRIGHFQDVIKHIENCGMGIIGNAPQSLGLCLYELKEKIVIDDYFAEFKDAAIKARDTAIAKLQVAVRELAQRRAEQEELERLRKEAAAEKRAEAEAQAMREADNTHRKNINEQVRMALIGAGINHASAVIEAIASGKVPHVSISY